MNLAGYTFQGPYTPYKGFTTALAAVYAILDSQRVLDIGQTGDISDRFPNHDRQDQWERHGAGAIGLYVLPIANEDNRLAIESFLRRTYNPPCGDR